ncbi:MAG: hypothetical protein IPP62_15230 [bacterium]|nr:hypothetical protein [bacterium]
MMRLTGSGRHVFSTAIGPVGLAWTPRGICRLEIGHADADTTDAAPGRPLPRARRRHAPARPGGRCRNTPARRTAGHG